MIYLDNAATTRIAPKVLDAMKPYLEDGFENPGGVYRGGRKARAAVEEARVKCARAIQAEPEQIIFTSSGSEANALAILGIAPYLKAIGKTHIITSGLEHESVLRCVKILENDGFEVSYINDVDIGDEEVAAEVRDNTGLVSIMTINNELGTSNLVEEIGEFCSRHRILFHTDCVQAFGCYDVDVDWISADFVSVSGHKVHGPKGVGFLYARNPDLLHPIIPGAQEFGLRGGTENVAAIVGMGVAAEMAVEDFDLRVDYNASKLNAITRCVCSKGAGGKMLDLPYDCARVANIYIPGVDAESLILLLDEHGVQVSAGAACSAQSMEPSHVLKAIGLSDEEARSCIRVSVSDDTTLEEACRAGEIIRECIEILKNSCNP